MRHRFLPLGLSLLFAADAGAQTHSTNPERTTLSGIYTAKQASRGKNIYAGMCRSCHTPSSHTGKTFETWWNGHVVSDLFGYISTRMPKNDPGGLQAQDYADLVAYLLTMNAMPAGKMELPPDSAELAAIMIVPKKKAASRAARTHG